jgi:hypothetical protein
VTSQLVFIGAAAPFAETPEGWPKAAPASTLSTLLLLVGIPLALFIVITLLVYVPSMSRGQRYTPGLAWPNRNEWFGGPRGGLEADGLADRPALDAGSAAPDAGGADAAEAREEAARGGASARW